MTRVFIGLTEIAGYYGNLAQGFRELGIDASFVSLAEHSFQYRHEERTSRLVRALQGIVKKRGATSRSRPVPWIFWRGADLVARGLFFGAVCARYDVFIFGFNSTFFSFRELPLLRLMRKQIIYVFNGSDSRPVYLNGSEMAPARRLTIQQCIDRTRDKKATLRNIERYATAVVANPLSAQLHESRCVSFLLTGIPYPQPSLPDESAQRAPGPVRILHAPSHPEAKGTPEIRAMIERLRNRGHSIDYIEIVGRPNHEVLEALATCDFVIDQLYCDQPVAGFATEAAGFGRPAVVGGYGWPTFEATMPPERIIPVCYRHPEEVEAAIEALIVDEPARLELGKRARAFIEQHWTPKQVAANYLQIIEGTTPEDWYFNPSDIRYVHGACFSEDRARSVIRSVVELDGIDALQVSDKPALERVLVEFAQGGEPPLLSDQRNESMS